MKRNLILIILSYVVFFLIISVVFFNSITNSGETIASHIHFNQVKAESISTLNQRLQSPNQINGKPVLRIVNFNPGGGSATNREQRERSWQQFAQYLVEQQAEIILIQEPGKAELATIRRIMEPHFPYSRWIHYPSGINDPNEIPRGGELNPIFSKYPFVEGTQQEWKISPSDKERDRNRIALSVEVRTPYGDVRLVNLHTHGDTQCADAYQALLPITNSASPLFNSPEKPFIIAGDFNIALKQVKPAYDPARRNTGALLSRGVCDFKYSKKYVNVDDLEKLIRENYKAYCLDEGRCRNVGTIEMIWTLNNNPIEIYQMWWGDDIYRHIFDDANKHPVVFADIGNPSWTIATPPPPTSLPPPTNLTQQCGSVASADKMNSQFSWSQVNGAERYVLRINKRNTCTNDAGASVEWFCPETDGRGDVWQFVPAGNCSSGTCNYTHPLLANTDYSDWSVQAVRPGGTGQLSEGGQSPQQTGFRCVLPSPSPSPTLPPQPIEGDLNNDGVVNQTDYNLMVTNLYTNNCAFTVPRRTSACEVNIGDLNRLIRLMRR